MAGWYDVIDGLVLPKRISGHPGLEWTNTKSGWGEPAHPRQDYLQSYGHLLLASRREDLIDKARADALTKLAHRHPAEAQRALDECRALRADAYAVFTGSSSAAARGRLAQAATAAQHRLELRIGPDGASWALPRQARLSDPLDLFVIQAADLLVTGAAAIVASCPGHDCGWLFLNTSGKRRWCQMAVCGNRAKQAAFTGKRRPESPLPA